MRKVCLPLLNKASNSSTMCVNNYQYNPHHHTNSSVAQRAHLPRRTLTSETVKLSRLSMIPSTPHQASLLPYRQSSLLSGCTVFPQTRRQFSRSAESPAYPGISLHSIKTFLRKKGVNHTESHPSKFSNIVDLTVLRLAFFMRYGSNKVVQ